MTLDRSWLDDLQGVDTLAILTDADLLSHKNGHSLFYDGIEPLVDQCILISADPQYLLQNLKHVTPSSEFYLNFKALETKKHTLAHTCPTSPLYVTSFDQFIAVPILKDQVATLDSGTCTIRPVYVRKRSDRDTRRGDVLIFIKEYHFNNSRLLYTSSWLSSKESSLAEIPTEGNVGRVDRSDVLRFTNDYYTYDFERPQIQDQQTLVKNLTSRTVVVHNHLTFWTSVFTETWSFFPQHAPYQKSPQSLFREKLWLAAQSGDLCDVVIQGDCFDIPAHSIILGTVPYYRVMFTSMLSEGLESRQRHYCPNDTFDTCTDSKEPRNCVQVLCAPPLTPESVMRGFLFYVYMGRLPLEVYVSREFGLDLIMVADYYGHSELVCDAAHAVPIDDPEHVLDVAEAIEEGPGAILLKERAASKMLIELV